ncbi:FAD-binding oxidoreductase [Corynebacterium sp. A21]|uniref:FAD-binding oxidoreductase n=1 Tax=Corynebacterium sp. A21 TaxID=3457318 RepID=UPI003FD51E45
MGNVIPSETLSDVASKVRAQEARFLDLVHDHFFTSILEARSIFPLSRERTHLQLVPAITDVLDRTPLSGEVPQHVLNYVAGHGVQHRRHGFPSEAYEPFGEALAAALDDALPATNPAIIAAAQKALRQVCRSMAAAALEQDLAGVPAAYLATITHVERRSRRISVVHLETPGMKYHAGQHIPVAMNFLPGTWRNLSPALPANDYGQLEFHIQIHEKGTVSPMLATPRVGDFWTLGAPTGNLVPQSSSPLLLIAHRMGLAPMRAIIFDLLQKPGPHRPVHLIMSAEYPGELHDLLALWNVAQAVDWLEITPVVEHDTDPWWVGATTTSQRPEGLELQVSADLGACVLAQGRWPNHEVLVAGPARGVHETVRTLYRGGVPFNHVHYEAW